MAAVFVLGAVLAAGMRLAFVIRFEAGGDPDGRLVLRPALERLCTRGGPRGALVLPGKLDGADAVIDAGAFTSDPGAYPTSLLPVGDKRSAAAMARDRAPGLGAGAVTTVPVL